MKKIASITVILIIMISMSFNVYADTKESLQNNLNDIQNKQKAAQSQLDAATKENKSTIQQMDDINNKITSYQNQIAGLNDQISNLQTTIKETTDQLNAAKEQYKKQQDTLNQRIVAIYETGSTSYLDVLLNSSSLTDFISKYYLVSQIVSYDNDLLSAIAKQQAQIQDTENNLKSQQDSLNLRKEKLQTTKNSLTASKVELSSKMSTLTAQEKTLQQQIDQYKQKAASIKSQIAALTPAPSIQNSSNIVKVAESQLGNVGGQPYWSWYGYSCQVEWCACFVSWCANQCGYITLGQVPMFSYCPSGAAWFKAHGLWKNAGTVPNAGDIIFFCWDGSQTAEHVGIVRYVENGTVYTIEGNSYNACRANQYSINSSYIYGYGI